MTGRLPPRHEAAAAPSGRPDRRARHPGLVIATTALLAGAATVFLGSSMRQTDLGISAHVVTSCTVSTDKAAKSGGGDCAAPRELRSSAANSLSNSTADRNDRVTETSYIF